jgi:hypothetical protein
MKKGHASDLVSTSYLSFVLIMKSSMIFGEKRQENVTSPGSLNPFCSVFPVSLNPVRLVGFLSPRHHGGVVGRLPLPCFQSYHGGVAHVQVLCGD